MNLIDYNKVMIVDDEADLCELLADEAIDFGFEAKTASNGKAALELWKEFPAFLIISDINMPLMDGIEMLDIIRRFKNEKPYVVLCTGFSGYEKEDLLKRGAFDIIIKPFDFEVIGNLFQKLRDSKI